MSTTDVWAVGDAIGHLPGQPLVKLPLIEHWDGARWRIVPSPRPTQPGSFSAIAAVSTRDIWAVGTVGSSGGTSRTFTEHWDGRRWSVVPSPTPPDTASNHELLAVAAVAPDDVWAVGEGPLIEHWDGVRWRLVPPAAGGSVLYGVAAVSARDVWAVGDAPTIEHWDGWRWRVVPTPNTIR